MRTYRKPCVVNRGSNTSPSRPAETTASTWPALSGSGRNGIAGRRCSIVTSPSGPSASPWVSRISVPAGRGRSSRTRPLMFWPRSTRCTPGRSSVTATGRTSSTGRTGGAGEQTSASYPRSLTATGCQCAASYLVVDQSGSSSRRSSRWPSIRSAARMCESDQRQVASVPRTVAVPSSCSRCSWARNAVWSPHWSAARRMPTCPRYQPSASSAAEHVRPLAEKVGDVVGLHLGARAVLGEAGSELVGPDARPVQLELVDPVGSRVEAGPADRAVDEHLAAQPVRRPGAGRTRGRGRRDPVGPPVRGLEQPGLDGDRLRPRARAAVGLDAHPYVAPLPGGERPARPRHQHGRVALDPLGGAVVEPQLVGKLPGAAGRETPGEPRPPLPDAEAVTVLDPQVLRTGVRLARAHPDSQPRAPSRRNQRTGMGGIRRGDPGLTRRWAPRSARPRRSRGRGSPGPGRSARAPPPRTRTPRR